MATPHRITRPRLVVSSAGMGDDLTHECTCGARLDPGRLVGLELKDRGRVLGRVLSAQATEQGMRCRITVSDPAAVTSVKRIAARLHDRSKFPGLRS